MPDLNELKSLIIIGALVTIGLLEIGFAFYPMQKKYLERVWKNFGLGFINGLITRVTTTAFLLWAWQTNLFTGVFQAYQLNPWMEGMLSFLILDLYLYFWHRLMHVSDFAWRFHQVHHTDFDMNTSSAFRFHLVEVLASKIPQVAIIILMGISLRYFISYEIVFTVLIIFHHSNFKLPFWIDYLFSLSFVSPNFHRVHHSKKREELNKNFSSVCVVWDRIFGTIKRSKTPEKIKIGLPNYPQELKLKELILLPFRKQ